jgi:hypothetical protein
MPLARDAIPNRDEINIAAGIDHFPYKFMTND